MRRQILSVFKIILYIVLSLLLVILIRLFLCNFYTVSSNSMEPTILSGDFILTDKYTYGARIFNSLTFDRNSDPSMIHTPGVRHIRRNDVVVFNYPYRTNWDTIRMNLEKIFIKRCIGLPGDSISAISGYYLISGFADTLGYIPEQKQLARYRSTLDSSIIRTVAFDESLYWDVFDFGPFYIPSAGATIALSLENFKFYHKQIVYETRADVRLKDSLVYINDTLRHEYKFSTNWYFMVGDNAKNSQDSRYIGLIPEDYIIGKASFVITSKDRNLGKKRWNRILKRIK